jgi:organic anion transporter 5A
MIGWMEGWMEGWMVGWMEGWMVGWMEGWMVGWMEGWMDGRTLWGFGELRLHRVDVMYCESVYVFVTHHAVLNCKAVNLYLLNKFSSYEGFHIIASYCLP